MSVGTAKRSDGFDHGLRQVSPLSRLERITLLAITGALLVAGIAMHVTAGDPLLMAIFESSLTVSLAGFAFSPRLSATVIVVLLLGAFLGDAQALALVVAAVALALVVRTCDLRVMLVYAVVWSGGLAWSALADAMPVTEAIVLVVVGVVSASSGLIMRRIEAGSRRLREQLAERARAEHESVMAERLRIADELHDVVAHDLTIIAMHVDLMIECDAHGTSLDAIRSSSRRALEDLRRVVGQSHLQPTDTTSASVSEFRSAIADGCHTLERAGMTVRADVAAADGAQLPRIVDLTLSRLVREATTNVLKHSSGTDVALAVRTMRAGVEFEIVNPVDAGRRIQRVPSGGFGLVRMRERVSRVGGHLSAAASSGVWTLVVRVPTSHESE